MIRKMNENEEESSDEDSDEQIKEKTGTYLYLRKKIGPLYGVLIYLIHSSFNFEECAQKLMKMQLNFRQGIVIRSWTVV